MKTLKSKLTMALVIVGSVLIHTACPSPKGGANPGAYPGPCYNGAPCQGGGAGVIAQALGRSIDNQFDLGLVFNAQGVGVQPLPAPYGGQPVPQGGAYPAIYGGGQMGPANFTGQAIATGTLVVRTPYPYMECPIPPGSYAVRTVVPANWSMQSFSGLQIEARGPAILEISLPNNFILAATPAIPGADGFLYPFHLQLDMFVISVNGRPCSYNGYNFGDIVLE
jgi:hypothetical protein